MTIIGIVGVLGTSVRVGGLVCRVNLSGMYGVLIESRCVEAENPVVHRGLAMVYFSEPTCVVITSNGVMSVDAFDRDTVILSFLFEWVASVIEAIGRQRFCKWI